MALAPVGATCGVHKNQYQANYLKQAGVVRAAPAIMANANKPHSVKSVYSVPGSIRSITSDPIVDGRLMGLHIDNLTEGLEPDFEFAEERMAPLRRDLPNLPYMQNDVLVKQEELTLLLQERMQWPEGKPDDYQLIEVGSRVEVLFEGTWYIGTVLHVPAEDVDSRYAVQCDADVPGVITKTDSVVLVKGVGDNFAQENMGALQARESDSAEVAVEAELVKEGVVAVAAPAVAVVEQHQEGVAVLAEPAFAVVEQHQEFDSGRFPDPEVKLPARSRDRSAVAKVPVGTRAVGSTSHSCCRTWDIFFRLLPSALCAKDDRFDKSHRGL